jgi:predicted  nucleic acid-binding Zn-ribbon protein
MENMPSSELTKARIDAFLDQVREINDKANEGYDVYVEKLIDLKKQCLQSVRDYIDYIKGQVSHYNADLGEKTHQNVFDEVLEPEYTTLETNQTNVIQSVIEFMEERDKIQNNVCINFGNSLLPFGKRMEKYIVDHTQTEKKFEYEKAVLEDENEDKL